MPFKRAHRLPAVGIVVAILAALAGSTFLVHRATAHPGAHEISIADASGAEPDGATTARMMTISLDSAPISEETVTVDWATSAIGGTATPSADGTVVDPEDYATSSGTATFEAGETSQQIPIPIGGDLIGEDNETFKVNLFNAQASCNGDIICEGLGSSTASITDSQGVFTITDEDKPTITITDESHDEGNTGTTAFDFTVTRTGQTRQAVSVSFATAPNTATAPSDYTTTSGTVPFPVNDDPSDTEIVTVLANGDTALEQTETFRVNLTSPVNSTITDNQGQGTIVNDDVAPNPTASVSDADAVVEGGTLTFTVSLSAPPGLGDSATIDYTTQDDTADAPGDYTTESDTLTFGPGETEQDVTVTTQLDAIDEADENVKLVITKPLLCCTGGYDYDILDGEGDGPITDDDEATALLSIDDPSIAEGDTGTTNLVFTVTKASSEAAVSVDYETDYGTATAPADYTTTAGTLNIPADETTGEISVPVEGDTIDEEDETLVVDLTNATNGTISDNQGEGTITDDDDEASLAIDDVSVTEGDTGTTNAVFTVTKTGSTAKTVMVDFDTADDTAVAPGDYTPNSGSLSFAPADTSKTITVLVIGDISDEPHETFVVDLSDPTNATTSDAQGEGTITNDDDAAPRSFHDFNGDGAADAVFGVPNEDIGSLSNAGAINVVYGGEAGLTPTDNANINLGSANVEGEPAIGDRFGATLTFGDFDGDGFDDLAVGLPGRSGARGAVTVLYGSNTGLQASNDQLWTQDSTDVEDTAEANDGFGSSLAAGDFNGDELIDLAIGVPGESVDATGAGAGAVNVLYGTFGGLSAADDDLWHQNSDSVGDAAETGDRFGHAVAAGDVNNDGKDDLLAGAPTEDVTATTDAGVVHLLKGSASGLTGTGSATLVQGQAGLGDAAETSDAFGAALDSGDIDEDGFDDAVVGIAFEDVGAKSNTGAVHVIYGDTGGLIATGNQFISQDTDGVVGSAEAGDSLGFSVTVGDFDGDGAADIVAGAHGEDLAGKSNAGAASAFYGTGTGVGFADDQLWSQDTAGVSGLPEAGDFFGVAVSTGDFDGDGKADLLVGASGEDIGKKTNAGFGHSIYGSPAGLAAAGNQGWQQGGLGGAAESGDAFGASTA